MGSLSMGPANTFSNVTDDPPAMAATQPRPDSTWPVGQFLIQLLFPDGEQADQTMLVSGLLPVLALERQLGTLVGCKEAAIYVEPNFSHPHWERLHRIGYITDRVLPNTTIPCPYLTYMTRIRVQRPPIPHELPMVDQKDANQSSVDQKDANQSSSSSPQNYTDPPDHLMVLHNYEWVIYQQLYLDEERYDRL
jgi:hypothetical protein